MNIRDLEYLVALRDYGHFGKAAEACYVSQPALSMQIKKLEDTLGVTLLERAHKSVLLTEVGSVIVERARSILKDIQDMRDVAASFKDPYSGQLTLGVIPTLGPYLLPRIMPTLSQIFPNVSFYLVEAQTAVLLEKLSAGKIDAACLAHPIIEKNVATQWLFEEEFLFAMQKMHPLARCKTLKQEDLNTYDVLLLEEGHCMRDQALALCHRLHAKEAQNFRATSLETLRHMVASGNHITLMPKLAEQPQDGLSYVSWASPKLSRTIGLSFRSCTAKKLLLEDLASEIKKIMQQQKLVKVL